MGVLRRTIYSVLTRFEERGEISRKGSGRPAVKLTKAAQKRLIKAASDKKAISSRKLARKFGVDRSCVSKVLAEVNCSWYK